MTTRREVLIGDAALAATTAFRASAKSGFSDQDYRRAIEVKLDTFKENSQPGKSVINC